MKAPFFLAAAKPTRPTKPGKPAGVCLPKKQKDYIVLTSFLTFLLMFKFLCSIAPFTTLGVKLWIVAISFVYFLNLVSRFYFVRQPLVAQEQSIHSVPPHEVKTSAPTATHQEDVAT